MMNFFRSVAFVLPQLQGLLLIGGSLDLLGGWNQTDSAMGTLLGLFLLSPLVALALLVTEIMTARNRGRGRYMVSTGFALVLFIESLAIDLYILSQVRM